ncbi:MAG: ABC transporter permease [Vagococcus sp.]
MEEFYKKRQASHKKNMMKYMKYVLNDHFLLVMLISLGGFGLYYSEFVKSLNSSFVIGKVVAIVLCVLTVFVGRLATLMKEADSVFLLPKERHMLNYLKTSFKHSILLPFVVIVLVTGVLMPLLVATSQLTFNDFYPLVLNLWVLKLAHLIIQVENLYLDTEKTVKFQWFLLLISSVLSMSLNVLIMPWFGLPISILCLVYCLVQSKNAVSHHPFNWQKSIELERKRMKKIYSFINLFTDVPGLSADIKRRAYLDPVLHKIKREQGQTYTYLYSRVFLRGTEYSGLVIRLTLIGSLVLLFSDQLILNAIVSALFVYLIGFQLLPMYNEFDYMLMTQLYPVPKGQKSVAVQKIIGLILLVVSILFSLLLLIVLEDKVNAALVSVIILAESIFFTKIYAAKRLKKLEKSLI